MKISVIIPAYRAEKTIRKAIESVPDREDIEVIVVDDGSDDATAQEARQANRKVRMTGHGKNQGVGAAVNRGLDMAQGEYVTLLGADDYLLPGFEQVLEELDGTDIIYYDLQTNIGELNLTEETKWEHCGSTKAIRRAFLGDTRNPEKRWAEDRDFYAAIMAKEPTEKFTGTLAKHYDFPREGSLTDRRWRMKKLSICIPVYNQETTIAETLESIQAAGLDEIEIVVADDASTDKTVKAIKATGIPVRLIRLKKNQGVGHAFNACLDAAEGEYVMRLDGDDKVIPSGIKMLLGRMDGTDVVYFDLRLPTGKRISVNEKNKRLWCGLGRAIRRDFLGASRCPEIRCEEDYYLNEELLAKDPTETFTGIQALLYNHPRPGSLCDTKEKHKRSEKIIAFYYPLIIRGGVEMALRNLLQRLHNSVDGRLFVVYRDSRSSRAALEEIGKYATLVKGAENMAYADIVVECSIFHRSGIATQHRIQWVHCVVGENVYAKTNSDCDEYIAVSQAAAQGFPRAKVFMNDLDAFIRTKAQEPIEWKTDKLKLVTVSRIATVKGFDRMPAFCRAMDKAGVKYEWVVVGQGFDKGFEARAKRSLMDYNVKFVGEKENPYPWLKAADYCVQLSDSESLGLSIMEAQVLGTPAVVCDFAAATEVLGDNCIMLRRDMKNLTEVAEKIAAREMPRTIDYQGDNRKWIDLFNSIKPKSQTLAVVKRKYLDLEFNRVMQPRETFRVQKERGEYLRGLGLIELIER